MRLKSGLALVGCVAAFAFVNGTANAAPLDAAACDAATVEQSQLSDVPAIIERGAEWAKTNAPPQTLQRVARWIELQEQLSFRCGRGRVTAEAQRAAAAAELIENPPPPPPAPAAAPSGDKPAVAKEAAAPAVAAPAVVAPAAPDAAAEAAPSKPKAAKAKPKSKPKALPKEVQAGVETAAPVTGDTDAAPVQPKKKRAAKPVDAFVPAPAPQTN